MTIETLEARARRLVQQEVLVCVSALVSTLAHGAGGASGYPDADALHDQAAELAAPVPDYESAAREAGWQDCDGTFRNVTLEEGVDNPGDASPLRASPTDACGWETLCDEFGLDPYDREVFEHWAITDWLADKLQAHGEKVDHDFAGLTVWARTTTGQAIYADDVIEAIAREVLEA